MEIEKGSDKTFGEYDIKDFDCPCQRCKTTKYSEELIANITNFYHNHYDLLPIKVKPLVLSGYRCLRHNGEVGGVPGSQHTKGLAADIYIGSFYQKNGLFLPQVYDIIHILKKTFGGVGFYPKRKFIHLDMGPSRFWEKI